jgi:hypothetical protein
MPPIVLEQALRFREIEKAVEARGQGALEPGWFDLRQVVAHLNNLCQVLGAAALGSRVRQCTLDDIALK